MSRWCGKETSAIPVTQGDRDTTTAMNSPFQHRKEGDLLLGRGVTQIATVVERATRFTVLVQVDGRDMKSVTAGLSREMNLLPGRLRRSLTWDRGMELADHKTVTRNTGLDVYFADPRSPWQRGTNENTNRLLRQYFPKGVSMKDLTQAVGGHEKLPGDGHEAARWRS